MNRTRRTFLQLFFAAIARAASLSVDALRDPAAPAAARSYRADVVISLLGVHLYSKQAAGSAHASLSETTRDGRRKIALSFSGGSHPERVHGVNYAGSSEEIAIECAGDLIQAVSFGFVTASPNDESFEHARRRIADGSAHEAFVAVEELHESSCVRIRKAAIAAPIDSVRSKFCEACPSEQTLAVPGVPAMFLHTVLRAVRSPDPATTAAYVHNGRRYRLDTTRAANSITGKIHDFETGRRSEFRLWLEDGSDLPIRIEFSPRSYLHITLEAL